jgi:predicted component of type VI protein secretion system
MGAMRRRGNRLLNGLVSARDSAVPIVEMCERASAAVDEFSAILADDLGAAAHSASEADADWLRRQYLTMLGEFAASARDIVPDPDARHGLAQAIQCGILRHERRLREVLTSSECC